MGDQPIDDNTTEEPVVEEPVVEEPAVQLVMDSILETVKKLLGLTKEYDAFDSDIIVHTNTVFSILTQMGVGPTDGFTITGYNETWEEYVTSSKLKTQQIKSYIFLKVRSLFDPPNNGAVAEANNRAISEMEYRLYTEEGGS